MRVINFWLNSSVFPDEMQYYPQRLSATSWNLAENSAGQTVGFSGTNDNHRLLPRQVKQYFADPDSSDPKLQSLMATNGRMLEIILIRTLKCVHLSGCEHVDKIMELLQSDPALKDAQAIIDAGALLAGQSNVKLAKKIVAALQCEGVPKFKGVLFFDNSSPDGQWMALELSGRILPKNQSPVRESDAFAIFDEPRCRGADLKLKKTSTALITIGPRMCKDKFMQAAGRMRALDRGQSLVITGTDFLFEEIRETTDSKQVTPLIVLEWTLRNTVKANTEGLIPWANQGLFFCTSQGAPELSLEDEKLSLKDYYGGSFHEVSIRDAVVNARKYHNSRIGRAASRIGGNARALMSEIVQQANRYGDNIAHAMCGMDEECERELELEREIEEEKEVEIPRMVPLKEIDWDKSIVLEATALEKLSEYVEIIALCDFVADQLQPHGLSLFAWSPDVFGTSNFFRTVTSQSGAPLPSSNNFLSIVDVFLAFPDNKILLISDREADELIKLFWAQSATQKDVKVALSHLSLLRSSLDEKIPNLSPNLMVLGHKWTGSRTKWRGQMEDPREWWGHREDQTATMQLFAGEVDYRTNSRFEALKTILRGPEVLLGPVAADPEHIVDARGNSHLLSHSELEKACRELAREAQQLIRNEENADASLRN
jgi:hypothetical protein